MTRPNFAPRPDPGADEGIRIDHMLPLFYPLPSPRDGPQGSHGSPPRSGDPASMGTQSPQAVPPRAMPVRLPGPPPPTPPRKPRTRAEARAHLEMAAAFERLRREHPAMTAQAIALRLHVDPRTLRRHRRYAEWVEAHAEERDWIDGKRDR